MDFRVAVVIPLLIGALAAPAVEAADAVVGRKIAVERCAKCHGPGGQGDGAGLQKLDVDVKPVDWTDRGLMAKLTDDHIATIIRDGGKAVGKSKVMPTYRDKLSDAQIADLVAYIRSLAR